jgi:plasmid stability protein
LTLQAKNAYYECMKTRQPEQYTIRGVPAMVSEKLRQRARSEGRSINSVAVDALTRGLGIGENERRYTDMDDLAGAWVPDPEFDRVIGEMDSIDRELWE